MSNSESPMYSDAAIANRHLFYEDLNDLNIFIEDAGKEYEYETLFKRLLGDEYRIKSIFSTGGKTRMRAKFEELGAVNVNDNRIKYFYLFDGDFNRFIDPERMINDTHVLYLEAYNIENYLIDENACVLFSKGKLRLLDDSVKTLVKFSEWKSRIVSEAKKLFTLYCAIQKYHPTIATTSREAGLFLCSRSGFERDDGVYDFFYESIKEIDPEIDEKLVEISTLYESIYGEDYYNLICGKFLLTSLSWYLRNIPGFRKFNNDDLREWLLCNCDLSNLIFLKTSLLSVMNN